MMVSSGLKGSRSRNRTSVRYQDLSDDSSGTSWRSRKTLFSSSKFLSKQESSVERAAKTKRLSNFGFKVDYPED